MKQIKKVCFVFCLVLSLVLFSSFCNATIIYVPADYATIQGAINGASADDTIIVSAGTYNEDVVINKNLILQGFGATSCTITGSGSGNVINVGGFTLSISGFTVTNGSTGFYMTAGSNVTVSDCIITAISSGGIGGGFNASNATLTISDSTISNNTAVGAAGMSIDNSTATITDCVISGNTAATQTGGGINCNSATVTITGTTISNNTATTMGGGGLILDTASTATITGCTISGNSTGTFGGGIFALNNSTLILSKSTISDNSATTDDGEGGGISCASSSDSIITNCLFTGNTNNDISGIQIDDAGTTTITNCTFADNVDDGSVIGSNGGDETTIKNCIIANYEVYAISDDDAGDTAMVNNLFYTTGTGTIYSPGSGSLAAINAYSNSSGNISGNPLFVSSSDYQLQGGSPGIDAGTSTGAPTEDILGVTRPLVSGFDIGCYESNITTWYFAEGNTHSGFDEWLLIQNVDTSTESDVTITYYNRSGNTTTQDITVGAETRYSVNVTNTLSSVTGFSGTDIGAKVVGTGGNIKVTRSMYWGANWLGAHSFKGSTSLATTWYLAEGSINGFDEYILILNPNSSASTVTITYYSGTGEQITEPAITVPASSRYTVKVNDSSLLNIFSNLGCKIVSTETIAVERAMYQDTYGHCSLGATSTATTWYFAEGCTAGNFTTFLSLLNTNSTAVTATITFYKDDSTSSQSTQTINANTRKAINLADIIPNAHFATKISSTGAITAERAMYWGNGAHCSLGETSTATTWYLPEGSTADSFTNYVLVNNPGTTDATLTFTFMKTNGTTETATETVAAGSRKTIDLSSNINNEHFSTKIVSTEEVVIERAMYWNNGDGHCSAGIS